MMIVLGLSFGVYSLMDKQALSGLSISGLRAEMWTRALVVAGIVIGGTAAMGTYGFEAAALCTSTLSILVPWTVYWLGLSVAMGLLIGTNSLMSDRPRSTV
jgi:hypothetical protein